MEKFKTGFLLLLTLGASACAPVADLKCQPKIWVRYPAGSAQDYTGRVDLTKNDTRVLRLTVFDGQTAAFVIPPTFGVSVDLKDRLGMEDSFVPGSCDQAKITATLRAQGNNSIIWANTKAGFWDILEGRELAEKLSKRISVFEVKWDKPAVQISLPMR